jgi:MFS superfamily sulfate permease-like transporter
MTQKKYDSKDFKRDFIAGFIVFLIALPLCLGIAQASGAPLFSGIVAGIIGGIIVGSLSASQVSVTGPAAGLTAIVLVAIGTLGSFEVFLCAVVVAGLVQLILGFLKAGSIANYFPNSVIEGMLAGIGLTIIIKQIPEAVGFTRKNHDQMVDADDGFILNTITDALQHINPTAIAISLLGLTVLFLWQTKAFKKLALLPSGIIVVILGTIINFALKGSSYHMGNEHLVNIPVAPGIDGFLNLFTTPDLRGFLSPQVWQTGVVIAVVASIETLLCIEATDKLDPLKRYTKTNQELKAQGIGNIVSGLIGGLPVTSVIVRSSANINAGARSKLSTIVHGSLLLLCVASIPFVLNLIPKAALAAILIFTGYRLCKPSVFKHMWKEGGVTQFIPFAATALAVVSLDLLKGVGVGLVISIFYILRQNIRIPYYFHRSSFTESEIIKITLAQEVSFLNKASIKETLNHLPPNSTVIIDASETEYIDFDVLDLITEFYQTKAAEKDIRVSLVGFRNTYKVPKTPFDFDMPFDNDEVPKRSAGGYKKLLRQLTNNNEL